MGQGDGSGEAKGTVTAAGSGAGTGRVAGKKMKDICLVGGICCLVLTVILIVVGSLALSITKIVMGAVYIDDCPKERMIPIFLIVSGCCSFLSFGLYNLKPKPKQEKSADEPKITVLGVVSIIGLLFNFIWLICGSVWVFPHYSDIIDGCPGEVDCCVEKLARFSLAMIIIDWLFTTLFLILIVVSVVFTVILGKQPSE